MKHYCRYCIHCIAQDETEAVCEEHNIIIKKTSVREACKEFGFCEIDAFYIARKGGKILKNANIIRAYQERHNATDRSAYLIREGKT